MKFSFMQDAAEEVRPRDFSWFRRLTTIMTWPPNRGCKICREFHSFTMKCTCAN